MTEWLADWLAGVAVSCGMYRGLCQISKIEEHNKGRARAHVLCTICNKTTKGYNDDAPKERRKRRRGKNGFLCFFHFFFKIHASDPVFFLRLAPIKVLFFLKSFLNFKLVSFLACRRLLLSLDDGNIAASLRTRNPPYRELLSYILAFFSTEKSILSLMYS